jgi:hypothetical protein
MIQRAKKRRKNSPVCINVVLFHKQQVSNGLYNSSSFLKIYIYTNRVESSTSRKIEIEINSHTHINKDKEKTEPEYTYICIYLYLYLYIRMVMFNLTGR